MASPANLDWLYLFGGIVLGLGAAVLGPWALFWDRTRGRRRCPRCWYDMSGVPGLQCPECGRTARSETRLLRTRRRWRLAILALLLGIAGYSAASVPRYQKGGWTALVPSSILVYTVDPGYGRASPMSPAARMVTSTAGGRLIIAPAATPSPALSTSQKLINETWKRLSNGKLARWQSQVFLRRHLAAAHLDLTDKLEIPVKWPVGEPIPAKFNPSQVAGLDVVVGAVPTSGPAAWFAPRPAPCDSIRLEFGLAKAGNLLYRETRDIPIHIAGTRDDLLERLSAEPDTALVREALNPHLAMLNSKPVLITYDRSRPPVWEKIDFSIHYAFALRDGDKVLGTGEGHAEWATIVWKAWDEGAVLWAPGGCEALQRPGTRVSIHLRGDAEAATRAYIAWPFDKSRAACWAGEYSMDLEYREHPGLWSGKE